MSERVIETQVIELKVRGGPGLVALEAAAAKANTTLDAARKRLDSLKKAVVRAVTGMDGPGISPREYAKRTGMARKTVDALFATGSATLRSALQAHAPVALAA